jgi:hypothetical protein
MPVPRFSAPRLPQASRLKCPFARPTPLRRTKRAPARRSARARQQPRDSDANRSTRARSHRGHVRRLFHSRFKCRVELRSFGQNRVDINFDFDLPTESTPFAPPESQNGLGDGRAARRPPPPDGLAPAARDIAADRGSHSPDAALPHSSPGRVSAHFRSGIFLWSRCTLRASQPSASHVDCCPFSAHETGFAKQVTLSARPYRAR